MAQKKYISLEKLGLYDEKIKKVISDGDAATLAAAKEHAEGLGVNYDAAGAAATVQGKLDEEIARAKAAEAAAQAAADKAQGEVDALELVVAEKAAQSDLDTLETYVGTIPETSEATNIVAYVQEKTSGIATDTALTELTGRVAQAETDIDNIEKDYLKAADKTELQGNINAKADQTALDAVSAVANAAVKQTDYDAKVAELVAEDARIAGLVEAEAERAAGVESGLKGRIETMEAFWEAAKADGDEGNVIDTLKEIQDYIAGDETGASEMLASIQKNAKDIADHVATDHDFGAADEALKAELNGEIAKKAAQADLEALATRVGTTEGEIDTLQSDLVTAEDDIAALQTAIGDIDESLFAEVTRVDGELAKKVDKVDGKGLSTNDLTNELKGQYDAAYAHSQEAHAPADAQKNVIETVKVNGVALTVTDKAVDVAVPTDNAELTNGAGYLVASDIANKADKATTLAGYGIADAYTSAQTDTAIANAVGQFVEASEEEINALFA